MSIKQSLIDLYKALDLPEETMPTSTSELIKVVGEGLGGISSEEPEEEVNGR